MIKTEPYWNYKRWKYNLSLISPNLGLIERARANLPWWGRSIWGLRLSLFFVFGYLKKKFFVKMAQVRKLISIFWLHLHFQRIKWYVHNDQLKLRRVLVSVSILVAKMLLWGSFFQMPTGSRIYIWVISDPLSQSSKKNDRLDNTSNHTKIPQIMSHTKIPQVMSHTNCQEKW